jgi:hypothetical protein
MSIKRTRPINSINYTLTSEILGVGKAPEKRRGPNVQPKRKNRRRK